LQDTSVVITGTARRESIQV